MIQSRVETGRWVRVGGGVYRLAGAPVTWHQRALAACLIAGPPAGVSHQSAAVLFGISGFRAGRLHITVPPGRSNRNALATVHRADVKLTQRDGIPTTSVSRTIADLAVKIPIELIEEAVDDVLVRHLVKLEELDHPRLRVVVEAWNGDGEAASGAEMTVVRALLAAGLPQPHRQYWIAEAVARPDLAYPDDRIAIELDSWRWHGGHRRFASDRARGNRIVAAGWQLLRATPGDLQPTITAVRTLLRRTA